jgi:bacteriocin-like protein
MKKVVIATQHALSQQLDLGKETVANLTEEQLQEIEGGAAAAGVETSCFSMTCNGYPPASDAA